MSLDLDRLQQRIIGVLVEKETTVPETYPLTLNALVAGCNQKSNRDPQMAVEAYEAGGALHALMDAGWVVRVEKAGARTVRYEHRAREQLGVTDAELAILAELLNRGPQSPGELKTRASRMHPLSGPQEVEGMLLDLAGRPVPYVEKLPRRPREHAQRWQHRLGASAEMPAPDLEAGARTGAEAPVEHRAEAVAGVPTPPVFAGVPAAEPAAPPTKANEATEELALRVEMLEDEVRDLKARLERIEALTS